MSNDSKEVVNATEKNVRFSVVLLTYNRRSRIEQQIDHLKVITIPDIEIIVVDNGSVESVADLVEKDQRMKLIRNSTNLGAVGRSVGMRAAKGEYVVTLDDDVYGLSDADFSTISSIFVENKSVAAINFLVLEEVTNRVTDWCHPRDMNIYSQTTFETNHISEGAVVFRKSALDKVGYYPESFFISHEGPDLAFRLLNSGLDIIFSPDVFVYHTFEQQGRDNWRRYYYDTRNHLWLAIRNYPFTYAIKQLFIAWGSVFVYAIRDGYIKYWFKGVFDGIKGGPKAYKERQKPNKSTMEKIKEIEKFRPSFLTQVKKRLFSNEVRG